MKAAALIFLACLATSGCDSIQQNSILNSFGTSDGINCDHVSTRDAEAVTVVTLCRDTNDQGKIVVNSVNTIPSAGLSTFLTDASAVVMAIVTPLVLAL